MAAWLLLCCAVAPAQGEAGDDQIPILRLPQAQTPSLCRPVYSFGPRDRTALWREIFDTTHRAHGRLVTSRNGALIAGVPHLNTAPVQQQAPRVIDEENLISYSDQMEQYSTDMDDWRRSTEVELRYRARRFGFGLATAETRDLLSNLVLPAALHQDPRYSPASLDLGMGIASRLRGRICFFDTRQCWQGRAQLFEVTVGAAVIARHFYADELGVPEFNRNRFAWRYTGYSLAGDVATNVAHELLRASLKPDQTHIAVRHQEREAEG